MKTFIISFFIILSLALGFVVVKPSLHSSKDKTYIAMTGRSTMKLWFKHWNWPYPLRIKTTYRDWPIQYDEYSTKDTFLKYTQLPEPVSTEEGAKFGEPMIINFIKVLDQQNPDTAFFKFCFVDFMVKEKYSITRFNDLVRTIETIYLEAKQRNVRLIIGNALPLTNPSDVTLALQKKYNDWLTDFSDKTPEILLFDMFNPLVDKNGKLKLEYERGGGDVHFNDQAFSVLDKTIFNALDNK